MGYEAIDKAMIRSQVYIRPPTRPEMTMTVSNSFTATNAPIADVASGQMITLSADIAAATDADAGSWVIALMLCDASGARLWEQLFWSELTTAPKTFSYGVPATMTPGAYSARASVRNQTTYVWQNVIQTPASFTISQPVTHMKLYGTYSKFPTLLKPADSGDALAGGGFLPGDGKTYTLIAGVSDEFNGTTLDTSKWWRRYHDNNGTLDHYNSELQRYIDNHIVSNGTLKLTAHARTATFTAPTGLVYPTFDSSMIRSRTTFKYGYVEARVKLPPGLGVWPAFWILPDVKWQAEIDIMEYVRNDATEFASMVHCGVHENYAPGPYAIWLEKNSNPQWGYWKAPADFSPTYFFDDWHVFSCLWEPELVTFYIDGYPVCQRHCGWKFVDGTDSGLASVLADLAMGDLWATSNWTTPVATDDQVFEIDYIRVYQQSDMILTGTSAL